MAVYDEQVKQRIFAKIGVEQQTPSKQPPVGQ